MLFFIFKLIIIIFFIIYLFFFEMMMTEKEGSMTSRCFLTKKSLIKAKLISQEGHLLVNFFFWCVCLL